VIALVTTSVLVWPVDQHEREIERFFTLIYPFIRLNHCTTTSECFNLIVDVWCTVLHIKVGLRNISCRHVQFDSKLGHGATTSEDRRQDFTDSSCSNASVVD
jgi:hypothetical protein